MSRRPATKSRIEEFLRELGRRYTGPGRLYLAGGASMVALGFRAQTEDIDYLPVFIEDRGFVAAVRGLIRDLDISAEPASPVDFIPLPSGWEDRSPFIGRYGNLDVFLFDPVSTALSKVERGSSRDIEDASRLVREGVVTVEALTLAFEDVVSRLETESLRVDEDDFRRKFQAFKRQLGET